MEQVFEPENALQVQKNDKTMIIIRQFYTQNRSNYEPSHGASSVYLIFEVYDKKDKNVGHNSLIILIEILICG